MSDAPQGPGWWQASDDRWYPPHTHPGYQAPAVAGQPAGPGYQQAYRQPGQPPGAGHPGPRPSGGGGGGVPKGLIVAGAVVLVLVVVGFTAITYVTSMIGDRLENVAGGDCTLVGKDDVDSVMAGEFELLQLGGLTSMATPTIDARVLADGTTCWATENPAEPDAPARLVRVALLRTADAAQRFQQERTTAQGVKEDRGGGITVESQPYFNKDVDFGDEAFCTTTDFTGASGVLVRRGDTLVYVSLTSGTFTPQFEPGGPDDAIRSADDDAHCDLAQRLAEHVE